MLDKTDMLILEELSQNSRITMKGLGEKVHLTGRATPARVAKLEVNVMKSLKMSNIIRAISQE